MHDSLEGAGIPGRFLRDALVHKKLRWETKNNFSRLLKNIYDEKETPKAVLLHRCVQS